MLGDLKKVIEQVSKDKGIPREMIIDALETAMLTAARKKLGQQCEIEAHFNEDAGEVELFTFKTVVENVTNREVELAMEEAKRLDSEAQVGDSIGEKIDSKQFGRVAAQTAKQVIIQKVRDAERDIVYNEYKDRVGELITGIVRRIEKGNYIVDLGRTEAIVPLREQVRSETYNIGDRLQGYFLSIQKASQGPQIVLSRRNVNLLTKLFEMEVPEIAESVVEIKKVAREPGFRSKIAVYSKDSDVDPVGACVGMKGSRVQSIVQEMRGEKIDIVCWDNDAARFVCNAIAPAEVTKVIINEKTHSMEIVVPDDQLSLGIGKKGQNVRLAAELVGWNIDIYSETRLEEMSTQAKQLLVQALNVDENVALILYSQAYRSPVEIAESSIVEFKKVPGVGAVKLEEIKAKAEEYVKNKKSEAAGPAKEKAETTETAGETIKEETAKEDSTDLKEVKGIGPKTLEKLTSAGIVSRVELLKMTPDQLAEKAGMTPIKAGQIIEACKDGR